MGPTPKHWDEVSRQDIKMKGAGQGSVRADRGTFAAFEIAVIVPTLGMIAYLAASRPSHLTHHPDLLLWAGLLALVELLPVPFWRDMHLSMGFPLLIAVGFLYTPVAAGSVALVGSFDLRELKREVSPLRAVFNRSQVALSVTAASAVFHAVASVRSPIPLLFG